MRGRSIAAWLASAMLAGAACSSGGPADPCRGVGCSSRGFCIADQGDAYCACITGFHPLELACVPNDPDQPCLDIDCGGHGTCRVVGEGPTCDCTTGYRTLTGDECDAYECDLVCVSSPPTDGGDVADDGAVCVPDGPERCDGRDNDCDGLTDEDFDLDFERANCGRCGVACTDAAHGSGTCVLGDCEMLCEPGWTDLDGNPANGCEAVCEPDPGRTENDCNGRDDDCDGTTDEDWTTVDTCGEGLCRRSSICHDATILCRPRTPPAATDATCDGIDDDCDGRTDEDCGGSDADADADADGDDAVDVEDEAAGPDADAEGDADGAADADADADAEADACVPDCRSRECGIDPVCGSTCGPGCGAIETCNADGHCIATAGGTWMSIAPGTFQMGSPGTEAGRAPNETQHPVTLTRGFAILSTEVTQAEFLARMTYNPASHTGCDTCPVEQVSWHEAAAYCNALSTAAGRPSCYACGGSGPSVTCTPSGSYATPYDCPGYRLPTEAEWEYAARAGDTRATYSGDLDSGHLNCETPNAVLDPIAWFCGNSGSASHAVGTRAANAWGLYDMLGNLSEWCQDWWDATAYPIPAATDPWGLTSGTNRAGRGGSWFDVAGRARAAWRGTGDPATRFSLLGFRPLRSLP